MKLVFAVLLLFAQLAIAGGNFPTAPNPQTTPGSTCARSGTLRYPERIRYCERNVEPQLKAEIIETYDRQFGYRIGLMRRNEFKIDHYIPLCAGGSNDRTNLWPQHESIYTITDPLEALVCEKMAHGRLRQAQAIQLLKEAKNNLAKVPAIINQVQSL